MIRPTGLIAAAFTPMHDDGSLWLERIDSVVDTLIARGVEGLYVCGSSGEGPLLTSDERRAVAQAYVRAARGRVPVIVQVGHTSLFEARALAEHAQAVGADAISATPATYFKPEGIDAVLDGIEAVAAGAPRLPFFYYHIPVITGVAVDVEALVPRAAARVPSFAGVKFSAPTVHEFINLDLERWTLLFGVDEMLIAGLVAGAHGAVGSTYNLIPERYTAVMAALERGDILAAKRAQQRATAIVRRLVAHGGLAAIKAAMALTGLPVGPVRAPLERLDEARLMALRADLELLADDALGAFVGVDGDVA